MTADNFSPEDRGRSQTAPTVKTVPRLKRKEPKGTWPVSPGHQTL